LLCLFFSSRRRHTRFSRDWSSDVCSSDLGVNLSGDYKWSDIAPGPDGKLYCAPHRAPDILVINPATGTAQRTNMGVNLSDSSKRSEERRVGKECGAREAAKQVKEKVDAPS